MHMQDFGRWPSQAQNTARPCFTNIVVPSQINTSVEAQSRTCTFVSSEKEYASFSNADGYVPIEGVTNDAGSIVCTGNGAGPIEGIRYDTGTTVGTGNGTGPIEGIRYDARLIVGTGNVSGPIEGIRHDAGSIVGTGNGAGPAEGIDLNKTPAQKSKRKKHRPKVLKEEKPSKSPKSTISKASKDEKPSGKRKYVRKTPASQPPPEQVADSNCRAVLKSVRQCLNFDEQNDPEDAHPGTQTQVTELSAAPKDYHPSVSINQRNVQSQSTCYAGSTTSSVYTHTNQMANAQLLDAHNMQKGVLIDLNSSSLNQIPNEHTNFLNSPAHFFQYRVRETAEANPLLGVHDGIPHKTIPDINSSTIPLQSIPTNFTEHLLLSPQASLRQMQMANQMLTGYGTPEYPMTQTQGFEGSYTRGRVIADQMLSSYILASNHNPPANTEHNSAVENSNQLVTSDDYLRLTDPYRYTGAAPRSHASQDSSCIHAMDSRREQAASDGAQTVLGTNFSHQNNGLASVNACHSTISESSYFPEIYKRMRLNNQYYHLNGAVDNCSTTSPYLSNNHNANLVSALNSNVCTLADAQRLIAREKSQASQRMISFGSAQNSMAKSMEMVQKQSLLPGTAFRDSIKVPEKQFSLVTEDCTQLPTIPNKEQWHNVSARPEHHQLQSFGGNMASGSEVPAKLHEHCIPPQGETQNIVCIAPPDELGQSINVEHRFPGTRINPSTGNGTLRTEVHHLETSSEVIRTPTNPINPLTSNDVLRTENNQLEVSPETFAAIPSQKRKVGRPRKEVKPGEKPKPRGHPKDKAVHNVVISKGSHTDPLQNQDISSVSASNAEGVSCARAVTLERVVQSTPDAPAPWVDSLDLIIEKIMLLDINKSDTTRVAEPQGALVPYKGETGAIIPFERNVKRKRSRAKVDLDPVTTLMWKLLMGPDMSDGAEVVDKDKEKWLDEERKIFRGRVDSFIARMHLVQGDRRFSPWKGSVVDSVVGVFLTQNVSDHLSSSAFMALVAKFPAKPEVSEKPAAGVSHTISEDNGGCSDLFGGAVKLQGEILVEEASNTSGSLITAQEKEGSNSTELFGSSSGGGLDCAGVNSDSYRKSPARLHKSGPVTAGAGSFVEVENGSLEDVVSSQNSAVSSQSSPDHLFLRNDHMFSSTPNGSSSSMTYTELLRMQEIKSKYTENIASWEYCEVPDLFTKKGSPLDELQDIRKKQLPLYTSDNYQQNGQVHLGDMAYGSDLGRSSSYTALNTVDYSNATQAETSFQYPSSDHGFPSTIKPTAVDSSGALLYGRSGSLTQEKSPLPSEATEGADLISPLVEIYIRPSISEHGNSNLQEELAISTKQIGVIGHPDFQSECKEPTDKVDIQTVKVRDGHSSTLCRNKKANYETSEGVASNLADNSRDAKKVFAEVPTDRSKAKKAKVKPGKKKTYDWDILRKEVLCNQGNKERGHNAKDSIDWEAIRQADVKEISETIRERGMNNMLAERIKEFLNRLVTDHGSVDLEWLRYVDPDKAKDYLLSIRGLGHKSVECVRLLTLHHMAFPVDTNVGRICVRLGWVPLQPLPESLQLHLLELYPMLENIQKYLWPRLCKLDQRTLYELHYQMITFGKVFCTKSKPNCNACPMRAECKHFASAFASARLALPGPAEKSLVTSGTPFAAEGCNHTHINCRTVGQNESCNQTNISSAPIGQLEWNSHTHGHVLDKCHPIIEEPASPELEPEAAEIKEDAIEDAFIDDPEEIPTIKLNFTEFTQNLKNYMQANNIEIEDADMSKALVAITPEVASIPTPKLKNVSRLRTEHQVYELPDSHPLLEGLDQREPDDPCPYLLSIWTPGETAQSTDAPQTFCNSQESGELCKSATCFNCNSIREAQAQKVRGTILIPCRTAMRGSFPLNGTYFQVNEVFADHDTSRNPIDVPRSLIWNLPRRTVYFGTSVPTIFKGLSTEDIQHCFWRGFVCVRGFDRTSRAPRPLYARLHFPASKITRNKKAAAFAASRDDE